MKNYKKIISFLAAAALSCSVLPNASAYENVYVEIIPETGNTEIRIDPQKNRREISPYIFGINEIDDISGLNATVLKPRDVSLSTYNWEINCSNSGKDGKNVNGITLVDDYPSSKWNTPALFAERLNARSRLAGIPVRLLPLPMMGYAAADSVGVVSDDEQSKQSRWHKTFFNKNDTYLNQPDINDGAVYIDEYVSFLVNRFGSASEGGINGYFLDSEPDKWAENFPVLGEPPVTFSSLTEKSAELANSVKAIDSGAFIFGPSLSGLQACIDLGSKSGRDIGSSEEYSWFIDYYLSEMKRYSTEKGYRLLDVLDMHYYTEAQTPQGKPVLTGDDFIADAHRMQSVRTLWDPEYTENSITVMMNKQFTPIIPNLQASIRMSYPKTRLSFSEYDFGGGGNMSGAIAQIDALGTFASQDVYLACLSPVSEDWRFQKSAINLFTNYDGKGGSFGDTLVYADNGGDSMSSVYAAADSDDPEALHIIFTNKQMVNDKEFTVDIDSDEYIYSIESAVTIDKNTAELIEADTDLFSIEDNTITFTADTMSAYMLVLRGEKPESTDNPWSTEPSETEIYDTASDTSEDTSISETESETASETAVSVTESTEVISSESTLETSVSTASDTSETTYETTASDITTEENSEETSNSDSAEESASQSEPPEQEKDNVPIALKIIVSLMCITVVGGVVYIMFFYKR
ncbi:MAG: hypothetical protein J6A37_13185 [Oscillospiraceae bacterium]|nr:hypothetical protein [Oscillospiraceae bacterium]